MSTNKKDAQANAARDFIQFLVRQGAMDQSEIPDLNQVYSIYFSVLSLMACFWRRMFIALLLYFHSAIMKPKSIGIKLELWFLPEISCILHHGSLTFYYCSLCHQKLKQQRRQEWMSVYHLGHFHHTYSLLLVRKATLYQ